MTDWSLWEPRQPPDNRGNLAVKQVFETYVYAYTLSSVRHPPFIVAAPNPGQPELTTMRKAGQ